MWSWPYFVDIAGPAALKGHCERLRGKAAQPGPGAAPDGPRATFFPLCSSESERYFATSMGNRTPTPWLEVAGPGRQLSPTRVESPIMRLLRFLSRQGPVKSYSSQFDCSSHEPEASLGAIYFVGSSCLEWDTSKLGSPVRVAHRAD